MAFDYSDFRITSFGEMFLAGAIAKASSGSSDIYEIARMAIGDGYTDAPSPTALSGDEIGSIPIGSISNRDERISIRGIWNNSDLTSQKSISEIGVYGRISAGTEQLIAYSSTSEGGEVIPPHSEAAIEKTFTCTLKIGATADVTVNITPETPAPALGCARMDAHNSGEFSADSVSANTIIGNGAIRAGGRFVTTINIAAGSMIFVNVGSLGNSFGCNETQAGPSSAIEIQNLDGMNLGLILSGTGIVGGCYLGSGNLMSSAALTSGATYSFVLF